MSLEYYPWYVTFYGFLSFALYPWFGVVRVDVSHGSWKVGYLSLGTEGGGSLQEKLWCPGKECGWGGRKAASHQAHSPLPSLLHPQPFLNYGSDLSPGPKLRGPGARRPSLLPQGCQPFLPTSPETQAWSPMRELDLGSSLKPVSDYRIPGELGKCPQGLGPDWGQGGLLGYGLSSKTTVSAPFGGGGRLLWPILSLRTSPTPLFPIHLALGLPLSPRCPP